MNARKKEEALRASSAADAAAQLEVAEDEMLAFVEYYNTTQVGHHNYQLANWRKELGRARAPSVVDYFIQQHRGVLKEAASSACAANPQTALTPEKLIRFAEGRLKVHGDARECVHAMSEQMLDKVA